MYISTCIVSFLKCLKVVTCHKKQTFTKETEGEEMEVWRTPVSRSCRAAVEPHHFRLSVVTENTLTPLIHFHNTCLSRAFRSSPQLCLTATPGLRENNRRSFTVTPASLLISVVPPQLARLWQQHPASRALCRPP